MSNSDWRPIIALGFICLAAVLVWDWAGETRAGRDFLRCQNNYEKPRYRPDDVQPPDQSPVPGLSKKRLQSPYKQLDCEQPENPKAYEYCQQWRTTRAAEEQACVARRAFYIGVAGLLGLLGTMIYTAQAADGARKAAEVADRALVASQRAWIRRDQITFCIPLQFESNGLLHGAIRFEFTNVGNMPATHVNKFAWFVPVTDGLVPEHRAKELFEGVRRHPVSSGFTLFPNQRYPRARDIPVSHSLVLADAETNPATDSAGRISLYVAACINYSFASDPTKNHQTSCLFEVRAPTFITRGMDDIPETQLSLLEIPGFGGMDLAN